MITDKILYALGIEIKRTLPRPMIRFMKKSILNQKLVGVEIGCFRGFNAESILKTLNIEKLYLIDPYALYSDGGINPHKSLKNAKIEMLKKIKKFKNKCKVIEKTSNNAVNLIPNELDFVYIDGNHNYDFVRKDIENYFKKLKIGGVLGGHDFYNGLQKEHDGVVRAVLEFVNSKKIKLYVQYPDWWIIKNEKTKTS